jgi:hypothetical protein
VTFEPGIKRPTSAWRAISRSKDATTASPGSRAARRVEMVDGEKNWLSLFAALTTIAVGSPNLSAQLLSPLPAVYHDAKTLLCVPSFLPGVCGRTKTVVASFPMAPGTRRATRRQFGWTSGAVGGRRCAWVHNSVGTHVLALIFALSFGTHLPLPTLLSIHLNRMGVKVINGKMIPMDQGGCSVYKEKVEGHP